MGTGNKKADAATALTRNLHDAIARVREDVSKVEFWADAVSGFTQPVPAYNSSDANIWLPTEQAKKLRDNPTANGGVALDGPVDKTKT